MSRSAGRDYPLQRPGAFRSRSLWPRTGLDVRKGSRTVTCFRRRGPSGRRSVPITHTETWPQASLGGRSVRPGPLSRMLSPALVTGLSQLVQGRRDGSDSAARSPPTALQACAEWRRKVGLSLSFRLGVWKEAGLRSGISRQLRGGSANVHAAEGRTRSPARGKAGLATGPGRGGARCARRGGENLDLFC